MASHRNSKSRLRRTTGLITAGVLMIVGAAVTGMLWPAFEPVAVGAIPGASLFVAGLAVHGLIDLRFPRSP